MPQTVAAEIAPIVEQEHAPFAETLHIPEVVPEAALAQLPAPENVPSSPVEDAAEPIQQQLTSPVQSAQIPTPVTPRVTPPIVTQSQPLAISASEPLLISAFKITQTRGFDFIEVKNTTDSMVDLRHTTIHLLYSTATEDYDCQIALTGYARPNSYMTYATQPGNDAAYLVEGCPNPQQPLFDKELQVWRGGQLVEVVRIAAGDIGASAEKQWERKVFTASGRTGIFATDFKTSTRGMYTSSVYEAPVSPTIQFLEVFPRSVPCSSGDESPICRPYIKVKNTGDSDIDLSQFRLRNGSLTAQSSRYNTSALAGIVPAGEFVTITLAADGKPLALNGEDGATWLEDAYGVQAYVNTDAPYADAELVAQAGRSWALDASDATWKWATPAPYTEANDFTEPGKGAAKLAESSLKPCRDDQYRSEETNRCRSIASGTSGLTPCKEGQYRSEETNRCRSIASAAKAGLKPCRDDQYRSEETNRCRNLASTASSLKPCKDNQYRSEETNRCRTIQASTPPAAAYAVEPIKQGAMSFVGWWALGGVLLCALGYGAWEWRSEIRRGIGRAASVFRRDK